MKNVKLTIAEIGLIGATRAMLGAGAALLITNKLGKKQRRAAGWALLAAGAATSMPLGLEILGKMLEQARQQGKKGGKAKKARKTRK